jgi:hypothetical protein
MATRIRDYFHVLAAILFFAALANFLVFFAVAIYIGGDAWNGKVEEGRYYVLAMANIQRFHRKCGTTAMPMSSAS